MEAKHLASYIAVALMITSCTFVPSTQNLVRKGMNRAVVHDVLDQAASASSAIDVPSDTINRYIVEIYFSQEDEIRKKHVFAYRNDSLLYWGMPHELLRHPSQIMNEIGAAAAKLQ